MDGDICINQRTRRLDEAQQRRSLLNVLREDFLLTGTKEGCASGDCGACTVVACKPEGEVHTVNSCITPAGAYVGGAVLTVDGVSSGGAQVAAQMHPVQRAMVDLHGAQCGFCTPGFIMSMVGAQLMEAHAATPSPDRAARQIGGNLCRCTGYRPILAALREAWADPQREACNAAFGWLTGSGSAADSAVYRTPQNLSALTDLIRAFASADDYTVVAGSTDLWLQYSQLYRDFDCLLDVSQVAEMRQIERSERQLRIGAAVTHTELEHFFSQALQMPAVVDLLHRFGSPQIRARGTIGGNIANASPIADLPPILLCLDASLDILGRDGEVRSIPLLDFYHGYRQTALAPGEVIVRVVCTLPDAPSRLQAYKISKREEDDISSVLGVFWLAHDEQGALTDARIAYGGVAATPVRLSELETDLEGLVLTDLDEAGLLQVSRRAADHVTPITDVRATAGYRTEMVVSLLHKALMRALADLRGVTLMELRDVQ